MTATPTLLLGTGFGGAYSRFSYGSTGAEGKRQIALLKEKNVPVLDDDFVWIQDALLTYIRKAVGDLLGNGSSPNNGFFIDGSGNLNNNFTVKGGDGTVDGAGVLYAGGLRVINLSNFTYNSQAGVPALTPPGAGTRTDTVYVDCLLDEQGPTGDASMVDPTLATESSRRMQLTFQVLVAVGVAPPAQFYVDGANRLHFTASLATIVRTTSAVINAGMITDVRGLANVGAAAAAKVAAHNADPASHQAATTAVRGFVVLATDAEAIAGTDANKAVTPHGLAAALGPLSSGSVPPGFRGFYMGAAPPPYWLVADGSAVSRVTYATLFGLFGTTYGAGDGVNTFNLPDDRGRALIGSGTGSGLTSRALGSIIGEETHLLTTPEIPSHTHSTAFAVNGNDGNPTLGATLGPNPPPGNYTGSDFSGNSVTITSAATGGGAAHNNMPPSRAYLPIIKY